MRSHTRESREKKIFNSADVDNLTPKTIHQELLSKGNKPTLGGHQTELKPLLHPFRRWKEMLVQALEALKIRVLSLSVVTAMAVLLVTASPALAKKKAAAAPAPRAMTPMDIATMESVGEIAISPDGNTFAFVRRVGREPLKEKDGGSWTRLAMIGKNGELRTYMGGNINVGSLSFTPNGKEVAFLSKRGDDKNRALYTCRSTVGKR
jgi:hypothetical protein